ncbi:MAG: Crp/Fnr family transcriptional regulator [Acidobacteria bacterium]|nr:Crp/Fnr family transcriptional regulator [Acidobacteriota bacterium]MBW4044616.1 Crp/Fnr family transcriptional regulator [Acidobacteriota bacterium]
MNMSGLHGTASNLACESCKLKADNFFCHLSPAAAKEFAAIKYSTTYPSGSVLFLENEHTRGVFLLCSGLVKLAVSSRGGKTLILRIAGPREIIGLHSVMSNAHAEVSAETLQPCQIAFIRREDFLRFVHTYPEVYETVAMQLSSQYSSACEQLRTIGLSTSAHGKLARLLLHWCADGRETKDGTQIKVRLTHEQIAECVGSTRETVTRTLSEFKSRHLVTLKGATMMIPSRAALEAIGGS